jgi:hypothetical protein
LGKQAEQFAIVQGNISARIGRGAAEGVLSRSLFLLSTGGNDLFAFFARNSTPTDAETRLFVRNLVALYQNHVKVGLPCYLLPRRASMMTRSTENFTITCLGGRPCTCSGRGSWQLSTSRQSGAAPTRGACTLSAPASTSSTSWRAGSTRASRTPCPVSAPAYRGSSTPSAAPTPSCRAS